jgi:hypothetical protein
MTRVAEAAISVAVKRIPAAAMLAARTRTPASAVLAGLPGQMVRLQPQVGLNRISYGEYGDPSRLLSYAKERRRF